MGWERGRARARARATHPREARLLLPLQLQVTLAQQVTVSLVQASLLRLPRLPAARHLLQRAPKQPLLSRSIAAVVERR